MKQSKLIQYALAMLISIIATGCVTRNQKLQPVDAMVRVQNFAAAADELERIKYDVYNEKKDRVLYYMDMGLLQLYAKKISEAQKNITTGDDLMEEYRQKNAGEMPGSILINDNVITYRGTLYEHVLASLMLSLTYLRKGDFDGGFVELRRMQNKIIRLQNDYNTRLETFNNEKDAAVQLQKKRIPFVDSALGRMLSFWLYRADGNRTDMEVALRKYNDAVRAQPWLYNSVGAPTVRVDEVMKQNIAAPRVQILALTGRIPFKIEHRYSINAVPNGVILTAKQERPNARGEVEYDENKLESFVGQSDVLRTGIALPIPGIPPGASLVIAVPLLAVVPSDVRGIDVLVDGAHAGSMTLTESLERIAVETFNIERDIIYARTFSRAIVKMLAGVAVREGARAVGEEELGNLLGGLMQALNHTSEQADTRSIRYLPANAWTADIAVKNTGTHEVTLTYKGASGNTIAEHTQTVDVTNRVSSIALVIDEFLR